MVKEVVLTASIANFTAQDYYAAIYETPDAFEQYHKEQTKDPNAQVSAWQGGSRTVQFNLALNVPQMLKKMIGTDCIAVVETQEIKWHGKDKFVVESVPSLNFPGSNKFITKGSMTIATVNSACQVEALIVCTTTMPWPMQSTVEAGMASEAHAGIGKFLAYCEKWCERVKAHGMVPAAITPVVLMENVTSATVIAPTEEAEEMEGDFFYDAWDESQQESSNNLAVGLDGPSATRRSAVAAAGGMEVGRPVSQGQGRAGTLRDSSQEVLMLASLRELQVASHATAQALGEVLGQLKTLNESVGAIRAAVTGLNAPRQPPGYSLRGRCMTGYGLAVMMLAGVSTAAVVYARSRQRSSA